MIDLKSMPRFLVAWRPSPPALRKPNASAGDFFIRSSYEGTSFFCTRKAQKLGSKRAMVIRGM